MAPDGPPPGATLSRMPTETALDHRLATAQSTHRLPSIVAVAVRGAEVLWSGGAGLVDGRAPDADTQYRIGSITKTLVAVAVMRLRDEGVLALTDPVHTHLDLPPGPVTVGQLLMHAGGTPAETSGPWWERTPGGDLAGLLADLAGRSWAGDAGRRFHYSNVGYGLLGAVLARHRGQPWDRVVAEEVLAPLGMTRTTTRPVAPHASGLAVHPFADTLHVEPEHDAGAMAPAGQLWSTAADMGRWLSFLTGRATGGVLAAATLEEMCVPGMVVDDPGEPWTTAHGLGLQVWNAAGRRSVGHGGSMPGFLALVRVDVEGSLGVAVMANTTGGLDPALPGDLARLADEAFPAPPTPWAPAAVPEGLTDVVGIWYWGPRAHRISVERGVVWLRALDGPGRTARFAVTDRSGTTRLEGLDAYWAGEPLTIVRRPDGTVSHLDLASFAFTRTPYDPTADVPGGVDPDGWTAAPPA